MKSRVIRDAHGLQGFSLKSCSSMPYPTGVLMCAPDFFQTASIHGAGDRSRAQRQWDDLREAFDASGCPVSVIDPIPGLGSMTFASDQSLVGLSPRGEKIALLSLMRQAERRREVDAYEAWYAARGYKVARLKAAGHSSFEGSSDAVWHPSKRLIWGGYGFRSEADVFEAVGKVFDAPVILLKLVNERFYHLGACFCPLTPEAVLIHPPAFDTASLELILRIFPIVVTAAEGDALARFACNAAVIGSKTAILPKGATNVSNHILALGIGACEVDTTEFHKSGAGVYRLKQFLF